MATAWARILQRPPDTMRRQDHFFESGGTSLLALRLIVALGGLISLEDLVRNPVLSDVAAIADDASRPDEGC